MRKLQDCKGPHHVGLCAVVMAPRWLHCHARYGSGLRSERTLHLVGLPNSLSAQKDGGQAQIGVFSKSDRFGRRVMWSTEHFVNLPDREIQAGLQSTSALCCKHYVRDRRPSLLACRTSLLPGWRPLLLGFIVFCDTRDRLSAYPTKRFVQGSILATVSILLPAWICP